MFFKPDLNIAPVAPKAAAAYRPDIDGLRSIAVVSVLLYHLGVWPFTGGFVGVDVFFVISGYLISGIVLAEADAGRFSFGEFYIRRIRRLGPALLAAIASTFAVAAVIFAPEDLRRTAVSTIAAVFGVSNITFWMESGYFDVTAILKPLLHTWSLAVELQFYLFWPFFLVALHSRGQRAVLGGIVLVIAVGTAASIWVLSHDQSAAFFLSPFRMHEFAFGALVAGLDLDFARRKNWADWLFLTGLGLIVGSVFAFDDQTIFPGYAVFMPVIGTAVVIASAPGARTALLLENRIAVFFGRVSYSLYLVHWPLIVFAYDLSGQSIFTPKYQSCLFLSAVALAWLSYRFVEKPFQKPAPRASNGNSQFLAACSVVAFAIAAPALHAASHRGWVWRFPEDMQAINGIDIAAQQEFVWRNFNLLQTSTFATGKRRVLVIGDSQAADLINLMVAADFTRKNEIVTRAVPWECGLPYVEGSYADTFWKSVNSYTMKDPGLIDRCKQHYKVIADSPLLNEADYVIVSYYWRGAAVEVSQQSIIDLRARTPAKLLLVGAKGFDQSSIALVNMLGKTDGIEALASEHVSENTRNVNRFLSENHSGEFVDILSAICPRDGFCYALTGNKMPIYWDGNHLTEFGAEFLGRMITASLFPQLAK